MKKAELVKIRLEGKPETVATVSAVLKQVLPVIEISKDYPNRPPSEDVRRYVTLLIETEGA